MARLIANKKLAILYKIPSGFCLGPTGLVRQNPEGLRIQRLLGCRRHGHGRAKSQRATGRSQSQRGATDGILVGRLEVG